MNTEKKIAFGILTILLVTLGFAAAFAYNARANITGNNAYNNGVLNGYNQYSSNGYGTYGNAGPNGYSESYGSHMGRMGGFGMGMMP